MTLLPALLGLPTGVAIAQFEPTTFVYFDQAEFVAATGASDVTGPLPDGPGSAATQTVGTITFLALPPSTLNFAAWTVGLPDPFELAINGQESFDLQVASPVTSLGIQLEEAGAGHPNRNGFAIDSDFRVTLCASTFSAGADCPVGDVIDTIDYGPLESRPPDAELVSFFGVWSATPFAQVSFRELTDPQDGNEFFSRVFTGTAERQNLPLDQFEADDAPNTASTLDLYRSQAGVRYTQQHTFHNGQDEDWVYHNHRANRDFSIAITSDDPTFHVRLEGHSGSRFTDPGATPLVRYGDCTGPGGNISETSIDDIALRDLVLYRIVRCDGTAPLRYQFDLTVTRFRDFSTAQINTLTGRVSTASTGAPVGAFLRSSNGESSFSDPADGEYQLVLTANIEHALSIESPDFEIQEAVISAQPPAFEPLVLDLEATPRGKLFADSFEP